MSSDIVIKYAKSVKYEKVIHFVTIYYHDHIFEKVVFFGSVYHI